ncbi:hypothetical protein GQ53DRAFT_800194 [Thozetella sp. PMI_491]|nr:hypothetical protein GQ53DRAFT_800194 [Thozetella sp. PMI_491]
MATIFPSIPAAAYPLGLGLLTTSSLFFGNIGLSLVGPIPIIKEQLGTSELSTKARVRMWRLFFDEAAFYVVSGTAITVGLHLAVSFLQTSTLARNLSLVSAGCSALVIPYTVAMVQSTNKSLITLDEKPEFSEAEEKQARQLIPKWDQLHKVRYLMYGGAWATGLAALINVLA